MNEGGIFINYRVGDEDSTAAFLAERLVDRFGADNVFFANQSIDVGEQFDDAILLALHRASVLVAVVGTWWTDARGEQGRLLDRESDGVRRQIAIAITRDMPVLPILVGAAEMPPASKLPLDIAPFASLQYRHLNYRNLEADVTAFMDALVKAVPDLGLRQNPHNAAGRGGIEVRQVIGEVRKEATIVGVQDPALAVGAARIYQAARSVTDSATMVGYTDGTQLACDDRGSNNVTDGGAYRDLGSEWINDRRRRLLYSVDMAGYSRRDDRAQADAQRQLMTFLDRAGREAGLRRSTWERQESGDGELAILPDGEAEGSLVDEFVRRLAAALALHNRERNPAYKLRVRIAIHHGIAYRADLGYAGQGVVELSRLLESDIAHLVLEKAPSTNLVLALTPRVYEDTIVQRATTLDPDMFREVRVRVSGKNYEARAWLYTLDADIRGLDLDTDDRPSDHRPSDAGGNQR